MQAYYNLSFMEAKLKKPWKSSTAGVLVPNPDNYDTCP